MSYKSLPPIRIEENRIAKFFQFYFPFRFITQKRYWLLRRDLERAERVVEDIVKLRMEAYCKERPLTPEQIAWPPSVQARLDLGLVQPIEIAWNTEIRDKQKANSLVGRFGAEK